MPDALTPSPAPDALPGGTPSGAGTLPEAPATDDGAPHQTSTRPARRSNSYRRLFSVPGALAFTLGNLLARFPQGMFSISAVIMISGVRGSYALAGAVTATGLVANAVVGPWTARLVDRFGQARVAVPAVAASACGSLGLLLCVRFGAPDWTLFAAYVATAATPNTGGMSRARWAHLFADDPDALHTANSFEQAADEFCYMLGPVVAAFLCGSLFPEAGTLASVFLMVSGILVFAAQRSTEPPVHARTEHARTPLRVRGMPPLLLSFLATGGIFGSLEVVTVAFADAQGHKVWAGAILALQAAGSGAAGLVNGALKPTGPADRRHPLCVAAMTVLMTLPLLAAALTGSLFVLGGALLIAGMATAPTMVAGMTLVQQRTPAAQLNEGMTLAVTGLLGGIACGSAAGGTAVEHWGATAAYAVPVAAAGCALLLALYGYTRRPGR
ncbi:MFS transporter [Streptomyces xanthii]|uniref:MFS transporter n=1 Tax=Streptomyces xanthii TaxID=2768069 RepID=A0A7H1BB14_9ACTN|nr:MFS transporter [Streptomyces xanthii]QNS05919.1 MFS transporter [Streptomyces xanthii]